MGHLRLQVKLLLICAIATCFQADASVPCSGGTTLIDQTGGITAAGYSYLDISDGSLDTCCTTCCGNLNFDGSCQGATCDTSCADAPTYEPSTNCLASDGQCIYASGARLQDSSHGSGFAQQFGCEMATANTLRFQVQITLEGNSPVPDCGNEEECRDEDSTGPCLFEQNSLVAISTGTPASGQTGKVILFGLGIVSDWNNYLLNAPSQPANPPASGEDYIFMFRNFGPGNPNERCGGFKFGYDYAADVAPANTGPYDVTIDVDTDGDVTATIVNSDGVTRSISHPYASFIDHSILGAGIGFGAGIILDSQRGVVCYANSKLNICGGGCDTNPTTATTTTSLTSADTTSETPTTSQDGDGSDSSKTGKSKSSKTGKKGSSRSKSDRSKSDRSKSGRSKSDHSKSDRSKSDRSKSARSKSRRSKK